MPTMTPLDDSDGGVADPSQHLWQCVKAMYEFERSTSSVEKTATTPLAAMAAEGGAPDVRSDRVV